jgi:hypothetical protein
MSGSRSNRKSPSTRNNTILSGPQPRFGTSRLRSTIIHHHQGLLLSMSSPLPLLMSSHMSPHSLLLVMSSLGPLLMSSHSLLLGMKSRQSLQLSMNSHMSRHAPLLDISRHAPLLDISRHCPLLVICHTLNLAEGPHTILVLGPDKDIQQDRGNSFLFKPNQVEQYCENEQEGDMRIDRQAAFGHIRPVWLSRMAWRGRELEQSNNSQRAPPTPIPVSLPAPSTTPIPAPAWPVPTWSIPAPAWPVPTWSIPAPASSRNASAFASSTSGRASRRKSSVL